MFCELTVFVCFTESSLLEGLKRSNQESYNEPSSKQSVFLVPKDVVNHKENHM